MFSRLVAWAQKNERHLGGVVFLFGFLTDLLTFGLLDISYVNLFFLGYLALAAFSTFGSHILFARASEEQSKIERALAVIFSLAAQYAIGGILSGCLIFYAKSAVLSVSWPFIALIAAVFVGNELFRRYREHLIFQTVLFFFALYAYTIFALPIYVKTIGPIVFIGSTLLALIIFTFYLRLLAKGGATRLRESSGAILLSVSIIVVLMCAAYGSGAVPPIPLALREGGIYHGLERRGEDYVLLAEESRAWWDPRPTVVHIAPGGKAIAFASVFAPVRFSTSIVHHWERYSEEVGAWVDEGRITFRLTGGRDGGYRGYSEKSNLAPGKWRVSVETLQGQVIGRIGFNVESVRTPPPFHNETR